MSAFRYRQPPNEHAFEEFCLVLMRDVWKLPSLEQFGRRGERQNGVDLLDLGGDAELRGVQCKHHAAHITLPPKELTEEVEKAKTLPGDPLVEYWVLTTAKKSTATQQKLREINKAHKTAGLFRVVLKFWEDIEALIDESPAAQRHLELRPAEATLAAMKSVIGEAITPLTQGNVHAELDETKTLLLKGEISEAQLVLRRVRSRHWAELTPAQKARWLTLSGDISLRLGKDEEGAARLLEALDHTPDDEQALINGAVARQLLHDPNAAATLATRIRERFPSSAKAWAVSIDTATTADDATALIRETPDYLRNSTEVTLAIACRPDLHASFPDALERAVQVAPEDVRPWYHLGAHCLQTEASKLDPSSWSAPVDTARLRRAVDALTRVVELAASEARQALQVEALLRRASANALLGEMARIRADVDEANRIAPGSPRVMLARAQLLLEEGSFASAIPILRELVQREADEGVTLMLANVLWNRDEPGDRREATKMLQDCAERGDEDGSIHSRALDGLLAEGRLDDARAFIAESEGRVPPTAYAVLEGRLALEAGARELASEAAMRALSFLQPEGSRRHVVWVSRLLVQLAHFQEALPLLARLTEHNADVDSVRALVFCASRLGRDSEVLAACARARAQGVDDPFLLSTELPLLDRYAPLQALALLEDITSRHPEQHGARVHLASLALRIGRMDLVEREIEHLPTVTVVDEPEEGAAVVQILSVSGRSSAAMAFAYDLLRRFFGSHHTHRAFYQAVLRRDRENETVEDITPHRAGPGAAVCLQEKGDRRLRWFVLEDSPVVAAGVEDEISSAHELWHRLNGRAVGDSIELSSGPGLTRKAQVVEIVSKTTFRFRDVMDRWQYRFPEHQEFWMIRVGNEETGDFDPSQLLDVVRSRHERVQQVEDAYRSEGWPLSILGDALGIDTLRATLHAVASEGLPIRCCRGSLEEREAMLKALDAAEELVLDGTALGTIYALDLMDAFRAMGKKILIPHSLMAMARAFANDVRGSERAKASLGATEKGPVYHVHTEEEKQAFRSRTAAFLSGLEETVTVAPALELAGMNAQLRERLSAVLDESSLDSLAIATGAMRVLWTDDVVMAHIGQTETGTTSTWTQGMLIWLLKKGLIKEEDYTTASAKLVALGYTFTSLSPAVLAQAARLASWSVVTSPLKEAITQLGQPEVGPKDGAQLGALLVRDAFTEPLEIEQRQAVLFAVCNALASKPEADEAVRSFEFFLPRIFGVNAIGEAQAMQTLRAWKQPPQVVLSTTDHEQP